MKYPKFLFRYENLDFWQIDKSTVEYNYNDDLYRDSYNEYDEKISTKIIYLYEEGFFDGVGLKYTDDEYGKFCTFSITRNQERFLDKS